ncbi:hypothetical protein [Microbacterium terrisoli]|jgi:hypothetical protein|uniref:hypothetical protein n=1 Tax=Microbacterium terrisoli TaxID=3242192 RepID=UPI00280441C7|nr:hypothetical protein [Microbacterium protaetiae]
MPDDPLIRIVDPSVMDVASSALYDAEPHVAWSVGYAPELDDDGGRFLLASLHAAGHEGRVDVEIAATQLGGDYPAALEGDAAASFEAALADAEALETLYAFARMTAISALGLVDIDVEVPRMTPAPAVSQLVRPDASESDGNSDDD